jgi:ankyrin repeat protein
MKRNIIVLILLITASLLSANSKKMFEGSKCREAYLYHFLNRACCYGDEIGVKILLSQGADVNGKGYKKYADCVGPYEYSSPLFSAVIEGYIKIAKILLEAGADPNILEGEGVTPLVEAV